MACILAASLGACAPMTAPLGLENDKPALEADSFLTRDGLRLPLRHWDAEHPRAVIVALHGMSDYSNAFDMPAAWWARPGHHDLRLRPARLRQGARIPASGRAARRCSEDFSDCVDAARERHPGVPVFALGESMGGAVILSALADPDPPQSTASSWSPPPCGRARTCRSPIAWRCGSTAHTMPWLTVSGKGLKIWPSDNIEMMKKLSRDPLFQKETRIDAVWGLVDLMDAARKAPEHLGATPAHSLSLWRQGSDHSARAHRSRRQGTGRHAPKCANIPTAITCCCATSTARASGRTSRHGSRRTRGLRLDRARIQVDARAGANVRRRASERHRIIAVRHAPKIGVRCRTSPAAADRR